jgi:hypothetical protein
MTIDPIDRDVFFVEFAFMPKYMFRLEGRDRALKMVECDTVEDARNEAVRYLGAYLADHPGFADEGHWRVNVENMFGQSYLHVIVATVPSRNAPPAGAETGGEAAETAAATHP